MQLAIRCDAEDSRRFHVGKIKSPPRVRRRPVSEAEILRDDFPAQLYHCQLCCHLLFQGRH